jgi:hypothetical protein
MKILDFFLFFWVSFALLEPDPDPATQINADPCGSGSETLGTRTSIKLIIFWGTKYGYNHTTLYITVLLISQYIVKTCSGRTRKQLINQFFPQRQKGFRS